MTASPSTLNPFLNFSISAFSCCASSSGRSPDVPDLLVDRLLGAEVLAQLVLEARDLRRRDVVEVALVAGVDRGHLLLHRPRLVLRLVERRHHLLAARQRLLRRAVELGAELRERLELAVLREIEPQAAGDLLHCLRLRRAPTRETEIPTFTAGRTPE